MLVDSGAACHVCPPDWATPHEFLEQAVYIDRRKTLAPIAEDVRDLETQPVRQDAPLLAEPMRKPNCPKPGCDMVRGVYRSRTSEACWIQCSVSFSVITGT